MNDNSLWPSLRARSRFLLAGIALALSLGCNGDGDDNNPVPPVSMSLQCSGSSVDTDEVGLECPSTAAGDLLVTVVVGGPSQSSNIYGVKFDLVFDGAVLSFHDKTATTSFLAKNGGTVGALASVDESDPGRLVVAVGLQGAPSGVQVTGAKETVIGLMFSGLASGSSTIRFENGEVVDSNLEPIGSLAFAGSLDVDVQ